MYLIYLLYIYIIVQNSLFIIKLKIIVCFNYLENNFCNKILSTYIYNNYNDNIFANYFHIMENVYWKWVE